MKPHPAMPVLWHQGMLLLPQHFQQFEAYLLHQVDTRLAGAGQRRGGVQSLELDRAALEHGYISLRSVRGSFPDGLPFDLPDEAPLPAPLPLQPSDEGQVIALATARRGVAAGSSGEDDASGDAGAQEAGHSRYHHRILSLEDTMAGQEREEISLGQLHVRLSRMGDLSAHHVALPLLRVRRVASNGQIEIDPAYVAPLANLRGSPMLFERLEALLEVLRHRTQWQMSRLGQPQTSSLFEVSDFLLLQSLLRHEAALRLELSLPQVEPIDVLRILQLLVSDVAALRHPPERCDPATWMPDDPAAMFLPLIARAEGLLNQMRERLAVEFGFRLDDDGLYVATQALPPLGSQERIVVATQAEVPDEWFYTRFAGQAIIGASERLGELVRRQVPGIGVRHLATAPPELPLQTGWHYFELVAGGGAWRDMASSRTVGIYVAGQWPGLSLRGWIIRDAAAIALPGETRHAG